MEFNLKISLLIFSIILFATTTIILKKEKIPIKYSLLWYFSAIIVLLVSIFPTALEVFQNFFGFETLSNLIIGMFISILLFLTMALTIIVSGQNKKIILLVQEVSFLKSKLEESDKKWNIYWQLYIYYLHH